MRKNEIQRAILQALLREFYSSDVKNIDWMGYPITNKNKPSYHHIESARELRHQNKDDIATRENGAILGVKSHRKLNILETVDPELYEAWQYLFMVINNMGIYPIDDVWKMVYNLQAKTESVLYGKDSKILSKKN